MQSQTKRQGLVWGGLLILFGVIGLVATVTALSAWIWVAILAVAGLGAFGVFLTDRSEPTLLIPAYVLWAVALMVVLVTLNVLRDEFIAMYVLAAIALPFLVVFVRDRAQWWALIPVYVLWAVAGLVALTALNVLSDEFIALYVLTAIALPFLVVFLRDRAQWWALIPAYVMLAVGLMVGLTASGALSELLIPAYVMFAIAIPFLVVFALNPKEWWPLIPGGIMAIIGLAFLVAEAAVEYIAPLALVLAGIWILARQFIHKEPAALDVPAVAGPEADESPAE